AKIGVITFPGTLDDVDAQRAVRLAGAEPISLWHADTDLKGVDAVVVPGGFSYGDYLRSGAISALAPVMQSVIDSARKGMPTLGICNGFQILTEAGLLDGALTRNQGQALQCGDNHLGGGKNKTAVDTECGVGDKIYVPAKHGEGRFQAAPETIEKLEGEGQVVFRYTDNFNGSLNDIAGVTN